MIFNYSNIKSSEEFYVSVKISLTTESIWLSILRYLHIGNIMVSSNKELKYRNSNYPCFEF